MYRRVPPNSSPGTNKELADWYPRTSYRPDTVPVVNVPVVEQGARVAFHFCITVSLELVTILVPYVRVFNIINPMIDRESVLDEMMVQYYEYFYSIS